MSTIYKWPNREYSWSARSTLRNVYYCSLQGWMPCCIKCCTKSANKAWYTCILMHRLNGISWNKVTMNLSPFTDTHCIHVYIWDIYSNISQFYSNYIHILYVDDESQNKRKPGTYAYCFDVLCVYYTQWLRTFINRRIVHLTEGCTWNRYK